MNWPAERGSVLSGPDMPLYSLTEHCHPKCFIFLALRTALLDVQHDILDGEEAGPKGLKSGIWRKTG